MTTPRPVGFLRRRAHELELEIRRLEAQQAHLEKTLETRDDDAVGKRLAALQLNLDATHAELTQVTDELEDLEATQSATRDSIDELEHLVDSFREVAQRVPEFSQILEAMKLCIGALATTRRLAHSNPALTEPADVDRALSSALVLLAEVLSTAQGRAITQHQK